MIGIYFLKKDNCVVYVGQSIDIENRLKTHEKQKRKDFDSYEIIKCDRNLLDSVEEFYILFYNAKYNIKKAEIRTNNRENKKIYKYKKRCKKDVEEIESNSAIDRLQNLTRIVTIEDMQNKELMDNFIQFLKKIKDRKC